MSSVLALSHSTAIRVRVMCSSRPFCQRRLQHGAGWEADVVDVSIVSEAAWREAQRRAEVIRPVLEKDHRPRHLVRAAPATLGLSERQTYTLLRRCRDAGGAMLVAHDKELLIEHQP